MAQITTEDLLSIITNMNEDPIPNHKCKEIIEALHKNSGKKKILPDTPPYDFLGNLNTTGCSLSINERLTEEPFLFRSLDIYFGSNDPIQNPVYMWGSVDFIHNPQGIWKNKIYPPAHLISVGTHLTLLDNGRWNRADVKNNASLFAAMLRMAFGTDGFHYICSLSHDKDIHSFSTNVNDAIVDDAASRFIILKTMSMNSGKFFNDSICCHMGDGNLFFHDSQYCRDVMLKSITNKSLRDATEMSMKL